MKEKELTEYTQEKYGNQINDVKNRLNELSSIPQNYKLKDEVYFIEKHIKSRFNQIRCRQFRSAKKRKDTLFFPTHELAFEYFKILYYEMFSLFFIVIDDILPKQIVESIGSFTELKDVNFGESIEFKINSGALWKTKEMTINDTYLNYLKNLN